MGFQEWITKHIDWRTVKYGFILAGTDSLILPLMKFISQGRLPLYVMILVSLVYAIQPWIFLRSLAHETMTVMNLYWDVASDIVVTFIGLAIMGETISFYKKIGIMFSFLALFFMSYEEVKN